MRPADTWKETMNCWMPPTATVWSAEVRPSSSARTTRWCGKHLSRSPCGQGRCCLSPLQSGRQRVGYKRRLPEKWREISCGGGEDKLALIVSPHRLQAHRRAPGGAVNCMARQIQPQAEPGSRRHAGARWRQSRSPWSRSFRGQGVRIAVAAPTTPSLAGGRPLPRKRRASFHDGTNTPREGSAHQPRRVPVCAPSSERYTRGQCFAVMEAAKQRCFAERTLIGLPVRHRWQSARSKCHSGRIRKVRRLSKTILERPGKPETLGCTPRFLPGEVASRSRHGEVRPLKINSNGLVRMGVQPLQAHHQKEKHVGRDDLQRQYLYSAAQRPLASH